MAVIDDLNLKTTLKISGKYYDFELDSIIDGNIAVIVLDGSYFIKKDLVETYMNPITNEFNTLVDKKEILDNTSEVSTIPENTETSESPEVVQASIVDPAKNPKKKHKKKNLGNRFNSIFNEKDFLCKIHSVFIYQPMVDYLNENLPEEVFTRKTISTLINNYYRERFDRSLSNGSAENYASGYTKYLISKDILESLNRVDLELIKLPLGLSGPEETKISVRKDPAKDDLEEFLQWLDNWENATFTKQDVKRYTTLSRLKVERIIEDQLIKGTIKTVSDFEFAKVKLLDGDKLALDGTNRVLDGTS